MLTIQVSSANQMKKILQSLIAFPARAVSDILCDRWINKQRPVIVGNKKKCWWVAADCVLQYLASCLIYESEKVGSKNDPTKQVGKLNSPFCSHSGSRSSVFCVHVYLSKTNLTFHPFGQLVPPPSTLSYSSCDCVWGVMVCVRGRWKVGDCLF